MFAAPTSAGIEGAGDVVVALAVRATSRRCCVGNVAAIEAGAVVGDDIDGDGGIEGRTPDDGLARRTAEGEEEREGRQAQGHWLVAQGCGSRRVPEGPRGSDENACPLDSACFKVCGDIGEHSETTHHEAGEHDCAMLPELQWAAGRMPVAC